MNLSGGEGAEVIYALRNNSDLANDILDELGNAGLTKRKVFQRRLPSNPSKDYYFIHRETGNTQPVIVEYGFLDTISDANKLKNNYKSYAEAVVRGVLKYLNIPIDIKQDNYIVVSGDSLWSIAKKYNTTVDEIKNANNLNTNLITVGQVLTIPSSDELSDVYVVQSGDTLYKIAKQYNVTVKDLMDINNLTSNNLSIGQKITVPRSISENIYTVVAGDSLYKIANKYGITVDKLKSYNNLKSNALSIGQILKIPN